MPSNIDIALAFLEGRPESLREAHRAYRILMRHGHLTDYYQAGVGVLVNELRKGPKEIWRAPYFGMTTLQEQAYCEWYCTHLYTGSGALVELGTFLGSLTKSMVDGLRANKETKALNRKVQVYDLFFWDFVMEACVKGTPFEGCRREGDWFVDFYRESIRSWIDRVDVHQADLTQHVYRGQPIEFLMVDVMKYEKLCVNVLRQFFPALIPGKGILFHQDYLHFYEAWVHVIQFLLRDHFRPITPIDGSGAFIFQCVKEIPREKCLLQPPLSETWSDELIDEAFAWSQGIVGLDHQHAVFASHVMMYAHLNRWDNAERVYRDGIGSHPADSHAIKGLLSYVESQFGRNLGSE